MSENSFIYDPKGRPSAFLRGRRDTDGRPLRLVRENTEYQLVSDNKVGWLGWLMNGKLHSSLELPPKGAPGPVPGFREPTRIVSAKVSAKVELAMGQAMANSSGKPRTLGGITYLPSGTLVTSCGMCPHFVSMASGFFGIATDHQRYCDPSLDRVVETMIELPLAFRATKTEIWSDCHKSGVVEMRTTRWHRHEYTIVSDRDDEPEHAASLEGNYTWVSCECGGWTADTDVVDQLIRGGESTRVDSV